MLVEIDLFLQGTQHSFQKRNRKTATRASPHTITITARRLMESSEGQEMGAGSGATGQGKREKIVGKRKEKKEFDEKGERTRTNSKWCAHYTHIRPCIYKGNRFLSFHVSSPFNATFKDVLQRKTTVKALCISCFK